ncbi:SigE family RNA polymerase sigma factor [Dactylosporangium vinaceum]|uniref:SigE family RNA polymerase sigma factor n=1 Tax=Dactylosporangium vinaceum TaxID=53362 RepID=A0ABV5M764_9ACTN|nr:SigE family RNA polymerase sigma factor [Dactylosporangium vinaceum]UAC00618.1 SigE family RNA polymerase sigma factor [Dactylosporangium vinaceum]
MRPDLEHDYTQYVTARLPRLHRVAYQLVGDPHRADDAVQDALTTLYQKWARVREVANLDAYVHTMVVRAALADRRRLWSKVLLWDRPPDAVRAADGPDVERHVVLRDALRAIPEGQRTVLVLRFLCDLSVEEVAAVLGRSEGTVKSQTSHGIRALRRLLHVEDFFVLNGGAA